MRFVLLTALFVCQVSLAGAQVSGHSNPVVKRVGPAGAATGFKLNLRLVNHSGYATARVGLIPRENATRQLTRAQAVDPSKGVLRLQFPAETGFARGETREVEWEVAYGQGNTLKPGELLSIVSAWSQAVTDMTSPHVFGGVTQAAEQASSFIELPR